MKTMQLTAMTLALASLLVACGAATRQPAATEPVPTQDLADANNRFGFRLFANLTARAPGEQVFISPVSVALALQMTRNGAAGATRAVMDRALELASLSPDAVNAAARALQDALVGADPKTKLQIANSLWAHKSFKFRKQFADTSQRCFGATTRALDFANPQALATINGWVRQNTNGLIREIVSQLNPEDVMLLINAIYFKGTWQRKFDRELTRDQHFRLEDGSSALIKMMHQDGDFEYLEETDFQAVRLPYGNGRLAMYVFLPAVELGLDPFLARLTEEQWRRWLGAFGRRDGDLALPRFKLEYAQSLADALKAMGMEPAFSPGLADFSALGGNPGDIYIGDVLHKTYVEVNEEGTEAAAVTAVKMLVTAMPQPQDRFTMVVDRPFFCAIHDSETGAIPFMGAIRDPR